MSDTTRDPRPQQRSNPYDDPIAAREFRRYCQRLVRHLPIPTPFDE